MWQTRAMRIRNPADLRERAVAAVDADVPRPEAVRAYRIVPRTLERRLARRRAGLPLTDRPRWGRPPKLAADRYPRLRDLVAQRPDATLAEHADRLAAAVGVRLSPSHLGRLLRRLGLTRKTSP